MRKSLDTVLQGERKFKQQKPTTLGMCYDDDDDDDDVQYQRHVSLYTKLKTPIRQPKKQNKFIPEGIDPSRVALLFKHSIPANFAVLDTQTI